MADYAGGSQPAACLRFGSRVKMPFFERGSMVRMLAQSQVPKAWLGSDVEGSIVAVVR